MSQPTANGAAEGVDPGRVGAGVGQVGGVGLVNKLTEPGTALEEAIALAGRITTNGPLAVAATKRIIVESRSWTPETMFAEQGKIKPSVFESNDAKEGAAAFAEKRPPKRTGT